MEVYECQIFVVSISTIIVVLNVITNFLINARNATMNVRWSVISVTSVTTILTTIASALNVITDLIIKRKCHSELSALLGAFHLCGDFESAVADRFGRIETGFDTEHAKLKEPQTSLPMVQQQLIALPEESTVGYLVLNNKISSMPSSCPRHWP